MKLLDEIEEREYSEERANAHRHFRKIRDRKYISQSYAKLPNELKEFLLADEEFNTRYSYPEDYL